MLPLCMNGSIICLWKDTFGYHSVCLTKIFQVLPSGEAESMVNYVCEWKRAKN